MSLPSLTTIEVAGKKIGVRSAGSGDVLVLLHGLAGNSRSWVRQFEHFSRSRRVIAWDAPGYGGSDDFDPDVDVFTDALKDVLQQLGVGKFVLLGHSMGGMLAGRYACRFSEQLKGLILSCTHVGSGNPKGSELPAGYQSRVNDLNTMSQKDYGISRAKAMLAADTAQDIFEMAADISGETRPSGLANAARVINETNNAPGLPSLSLPTLVITGEVDPVVAPEKAEQLYSLISHCEKAVIPGAGHAPYLEKPDTYNHTLASFINNL